MIAAKITTAPIASSGQGLKDFGATVSRSFCAGDAMGRGGGIAGATADGTGGAAGATAGGAAAGTSLLTTFLPVTSTD